MKNSNYIKNIILLIFVCFLLLGDFNPFRNILLSELRGEVLPAAQIYNISSDSILDEVFPAYGTKDEYKSGGSKDKTTDEQSVTLDTVKQDNGDNMEKSVVQQVKEDAVEEQSTKEDEELSVENANTESVATQSKESEEENLEEVAAIGGAGTNYNIGINYSMEQLQDFSFLIINCYTVDGSTSITNDDVDVNTMLDRDLSIDFSGDEYKVLIYHSHGSEAFADSRPGVTEDTIIGVGDELTRILQEDYGINVYHDRTVYDMVDGKLDRNYAYTQSGYGIDTILEQYPSIEVVLDVHRDGVRDDVKLVKVIDGKPTAQIMFFNGVSRLNDQGDLGYLNNPNLSDNLAFSLQMHLKGKSLYGDLMRKIYIGGYCYNLDRKPRASLVEVGAQTNTIEEAKNAMGPLAAILYSVLTEK